VPLFETLYLLNTVATLLADHVELGNLSYRRLRLEFPRAVVRHYCLSSVWVALNIELQTFMWLFIVIRLPGIECFCHLRVDRGSLVPIRMRLAKRALFTECEGIVIESLGFLGWRSVGLRKHLVLVLQVVTSLHHQVMVLVFCVTKQYILNWLPGFQRSFDSFC
jgi:hypothetical protein